MGQGEIVEQLAAIDKLSAADLSVILDVDKRSITECIRRLRKIGYVVMDDKYNYSLSVRGKDFAKRYYL